MRGNAAVDGVGQRDVALLVRFDYGRGVDAGSGAESVASNYGVVGRNSRVRGLGYGFGILFEL
jgi:hypothetical protein